MFGGAPQPDFFALWMGANFIPFPQRAESKGAGLPEERKWTAVFLGGSM
jgi:hypothetical protein